MQANRQAEFPLTPTLFPIGGEGDFLTWEALQKPKLPFPRLNPQRDSCRAGTAHQFLIIKMPTYLRSKVF